MEPLLPPLHPRLPQLLDHLQLRVVDAINRNVLACVEADDPGMQPTYILKFGSDDRKAESINYEVRIMRDVLPMIDQGLFERLVLPEFVKDGMHEGMRWMLMRHVAGKPLVHEWSALTFKPETFGGKKLDPEGGNSAVDVLRDLRLVSIAELPKFVRRFDFSAWLKTFRLESPELVRRGFIEQVTLDDADRLFSSKEAQRYEGSMFTNGDFHPRNFILLPRGKIAVADWVGGIDPWEFVAMYAWLLMWGNPAWQQTYTREIKKHFPVDMGEMQVGLLVKAFDIIWRWRDIPEEQIGFARAQMIAYFKQCVDFDYVRKIFQD